MGLLVLVFHLLHRLKSQKKLPPSLPSPYTVYSGPPTASISSDPGSDIYIVIQDGSEEESHVAPCTGTETVRAPATHMVDQERYGERCDDDENTLNDNGKDETILYVNVERLSSRGTNKDTQCQDQSQGHDEGISDLYNDLHNNLHNDLHVDLNNDVHNNDDNVYDLANSTVAMGDSYDIDRTRFDSQKYLMPIEQNKICNIDQSRLDSQKYLKPLEISKHQHHSNCNEPENFENIQIQVETTVATPDDPCLRSSVSPTPSKTLSPSSTPSKYKWDITPRIIHRAPADDSPLITHTPLRQSGIYMDMNQDTPNKRISLLPEEQISNPKVSLPTPCKGNSKNDYVNSSSKLRVSKDQSLSPPTCIDYANTNLCDTMFSQAVTSTPDNPRLIPVSNENITDVSNSSDEDGLYEEPDDIIASSQDVYNVPSDIISLNDEGTIGYDNDDECLSDGERCTQRDYINVTQITGNFSTSHAETDTSSFSSFGPGSLKMVPSTKKKQFVLNKSMDSEDDIESANTFIDDDELLNTHGAMTDVQTNTHKVPQNMPLSPFNKPKLAPKPLKSPRQDNLPNIAINSPLPKTNLPGDLISPCAPKALSHTSKEQSVLAVKLKPKTSPKPKFKCNDHSNSDITQQTSEPVKKQCPQSTTVSPEHESLAQKIAKFSSNPHPDSDSSRQPLPLTSTHKTHMGNNTKLNAVMGIGQLDMNELKNVLLVNNFKTSS